MSRNFENTINEMLCEMTKKNLSDQDRKHFEQAFIIAFVKMYQLNLIDNQLKIVLTQLINIHFGKYSHMYKHLQSLINEEALFGSNHPIDSQKNNDKILFESTLKQQQRNDSFVDKEKSIQLVSTNNESSKKKIRSHNGHRMFSQFLNTSMKRLNIENTVKSFCKQIKSWTSGHSSGHSIDFFLKKLITIKSFYPIFFQQISRQFLKMIQELKSLEETNEVQKYGKSKLLFRYQNCIKTYIESDDILKAAVFLYQKQQYRAKIALFEEYQTEMKHNAMKMQEQMTNVPSVNINLDTNK